MFIDFRYFSDFRIIIILEIFMELVIILDLGKLFVDLGDILFSDSSDDMMIVDYVDMVIILNFYMDMRLV